MELYSHVIHVRPYILILRMTPLFLMHPKQVTPLIELLLLVILSIDVALTVMWHTPKNYLRKRLIVLKVRMYVCMYIPVIGMPHNKYTHVMNLLKHCHQSVWKIHHEVRVEWQIAQGKTECYIYLSQDFHQVLYILYNEAAVL